MPGMSWEGMGLGKDCKDRGGGAESREGCSSTGRWVIHPFWLVSTWLFLNCPPTIDWPEWKIRIHIRGAQVDNVCNHYVIDFFLIFPFDK